jgi:tetratricopeptide (TPR) repeat protein
MAEERRRDVLVFAGALLLRLLWILDLSRLPFFDLPTSDSLFYASQAARILDGHLLGTGLSYPSSPLYPYLIAPLLALDGRGAFWAIYMIQAVADSASALLLGRVASALFGRAAGWLAGAGWAAYGLAVFFSADLMEATLSAFLANLFLYLLIVRRRPPLAGLALGAACLLRPHFLPLIPLAGAGIIYLGASRRRAVTMAAFAWFAAAAALPLGLSAARNYAISGEIVLISPYSGLNAYLGNHRGATGTIAFPEGKGLRNDVDLKAAAHVYPESIAGGPLSESAVSSFWWRETLHEIRKDPRGWAGLMAAKIRLFWSSWEAPTHLDFYYFRGGSIPLSLAAVPFGLMAPLALAAAILALAGRLLLDDREKARAALVLAALTLAYGLLTSLFFIGDRFRLSVAGWIFVLASGGAAWFATTLSHAPRRAAVLPAACVVAIAVSLHVAPGAGLGVRERVLVAASLAGRGRTAEAELLLRRAVAIDPRSALARYNLARLLARSRRIAEARTEAESAVDLSPRFPAAHALAGDLAETLGDREAAMGHYRQALEIEPYGAEARKLEGLIEKMDGASSAR